MNVHGMAFSMDSVHCIQVLSGHPSITHPKVSPMLALYLLPVLNGRIPFTSPMLAFLYYFYLWELGTVACYSIS